MFALILFCDEYDLLFLGQLIFVCSNVFVFHRMLIVASSSVFGVFSLVWVHPFLQVSGLLGGDWVSSYSSAVLVIVRVAFGQGFLLFGYLYVWTIRIEWSVMFLVACPILSFVIYI